MPRSRLTTYRPDSNLQPPGGPLCEPQVTVDDPHTFERPWTAALDLAPQKDIYEYACHEGNRGLENILRAARLDDPR